MIVITFNPPPGYPVKSLKQLLDERLGKTLGPSGPVVHMPRSLPKKSKQVR